MLELRNISLKWFSSKEKPFIKDLNIKVNNGKILTIFGSSGIGKSSLINVIAGVYESNLLFTGDIILNNKKITNTLPEKRKIGLLLHVADFISTSKCRTKPNFWYKKEFN